MQYDEQHRPMVNINRADEATLTTLEGIGSSKAQAIILYREMFGGFANVDELAKVKGIGQKTVDNNRDRLSVID
ncbi:ComEA family DNA-binding protein [Moraxella lincolnii]|nr:ComEA family DNA-binding protein [Moraxella lincolnii]